MWLERWIEKKTTHSWTFLNVNLLVFYASSFSLNNCLQASRIQPQKIYMTERYSGNWCVSCAVACVLNVLGFFFLICKENG